MGDLYLIFCILIDTLFLRMFVRSLIWISCSFYWKFTLWFSSLEFYWKEMHWFLQCIWKNFLFNSLKIQPFVVLRITQFKLPPKIPLNLLKSSFQNYTIYKNSPKTNPKKGNFQLTQNQLIFQQSLSFPFKNWVKD